MRILAAFCVLVQVPLLDRAMHSLYFAKRIHQRPQCIVEGAATWSLDGFQREQRAVVVRLPRVVLVAAQRALAPRLTASKSIASFGRRCAAGCLGTAGAPPLPA